jgi:hypothetical protein
MKERAFSSPSQKCGAIYAYFKAFRLPCETSWFSSVAARLVAQASNRSIPGGER